MPPPTTSNNKKRARPHDTQSPDKGTKRARGHVTESSDIRLLWDIIWELGGVRNFSREQWESIARDLARKEGRDITDEDEFRKWRGTVRKRWEIGMRDNMDENEEAPYLGTIPRPPKVKRAKRGEGKQGDEAGGGERRKGDLGCPGCPGCTEGRQTGEAVDGVELAGEVPEEAVVKTEEEIEESIRDKSGC